MRRFKHISVFIIVAVCSLSLLSGCASLSQLSIPPLPTPRQREAADPFASKTQAQIPPAWENAPAFQPAQETAPAFQPAQETVPVFTPEPTPEPTPPPTPEPTENPNLPNLYIDNATYPESMTQGGIAMLLGDIYVDQGRITLLRGRIVDAEGNVRQSCTFYPDQPSFSLAGTVNAELVFGLLPPGSYRYQVSAVAENNSYTRGEVVLIDHPFEIFFP